MTIKNDKISSSVAVFLGLFRVDVACDLEVSKAISCVAGALSRETGDGDKGWGERQKSLEEREDNKDK